PGGRAMTALEAEAASSLWHVPQHTVAELGPRSSRYCIAVFVLNEGERILRQLAKMQALSQSVDIVLADGGSDDGSTEAGRLASLGVRTLLVKTGPGKLSAQMRMA